MKKHLLLALITCFGAYGIDINYTQDTCTLGPACATLTSQVESYLTGELPDVDVDRYAKGTSNAMAIASAGKSANYSENFDLITMKLSLGIGLNSNESILDIASGDADSDAINGFGLGGGLTLGLNMGVLPVKKLGFLDLSKLDLYFNFSSFDTDQDFSDLAFKGKLGGFGLMASYRLLDGYALPGKLFEWGGLKLTTGFQKSSMDINLTQAFKDETFDAGGGVTASFKNASANFEIDSSVTTIPVELSTYVRLIYALTFYGGLGMDYVLSGDTDINFSGGGNVVDDASGGTNYTGTLSASESGSGSADSTSFRMFAGFQVNIPLVSLYLQVNKQLGEETAGVNTGLNITW